MAASSVHADPPPSVVQDPSGVTYLTGNQLGKGGFAICYRAEVCFTQDRTGKMVALKIVKSQMPYDKLAQKVLLWRLIYAHKHSPPMLQC